MLTGSLYVAVTKNRSKWRIAALAVMAFIVSCGLASGYACAQSCNTTINVTQSPYNAKGDGSTDDTSAIQSAIDAATAGNATAGDCVYFPTGTYEISSALLLGDVHNQTSSYSCPSPSGNGVGYCHVTLYGQQVDGSNSAVIQSSSSFQSQGPMLRLGYPQASYTPTGITIEYLTLDGNNNANVSAGISAYHAADVDSWTSYEGHHFLQYLTIEDIPGSSTNKNPIGIHFWGDSNAVNCSPDTTPCICPGTDCVGMTNSTILSNTITNIGLDVPTPAGATAAGIRMSWGSNNNTLQGNYVTNVARDGIAGDDWSSGLVILKNKVSGTGESIPEAGYNQIPLGIELYVGCNASVIEDNQVDHWISVGEDSHTAVRRNTVTNGWDSNGSQVMGQIGLEFAGGPNAANEYAVFTDNVVGPTSSNGYPQQGIGISVSDGASTSPNEYAYWAYNTVQNMDDFGAQIEGDVGGAEYHVFWDNSFLNTSYDTSAKYSPYGEGFRIDGNSGTGGGGGVYYIKLTSDTINDNGTGAPLPCPTNGGGGGDGVEFTGSLIDHISIVNSTIEDNGGFAATVSYPGSYLEQYGDTVSGNCNDETTGANTMPTDSWTTGEQPAASFTYSAAHNPPRAGDQITFTNTSTGTLGQVMWDFNDGTPQTPASPSDQVTYTYQTAGACRVSLVVWDASSGRASRTEQTIDVSGDGTDVCNGH